MPTSLFRIVYCSRNLLAQTPEQAPETQTDALESILERSRSNNSGSDVTGALLYNAGVFAQVLEGPRAAIERTFERIQRDARHADITVLECSPIPHRDFPSWSMAHVQPATAETTSRATSALHSAITEPGATGDDVLHLLRSLVAHPD